MIFRLLTLTLLASAILTMSACQSTSQAPGRTSGATGDPYALLRQADNRTGRAAATLRLRAAQLLVNEGDGEAALDVLDLIDPARLAALPSGRDTRRSRTVQSLSDSYFSVRAQALALLARWAEAADAMAAVEVYRLEDQLLRAELCLRVDQPTCAASALIAAQIDGGFERDPENASLPPDLTERIWQALSRARTAPPAFTHRYELGWWQLQAAVRDAPTVAARSEVWRAWQAQNPSHPATLNPPESLRALAGYQPPRLALLLPLSGPLAGAGQAARDGFIAAALSEPGATRSGILVYDTARYELGSLWDAALADGAEVVVGPLIKETVESFAALSAEAPVPRLVLNYLPGPAEGLTAEAGFFQFGIAIEDEAESLIRHVSADGHKKLLLVSSTAGWSTRARLVFEQQWPHPIAAATFAEIKTLTEAVGESMQVAESESRHGELARILGEELEFLPRARSDLDAVVALTNQVESQALVPALRFHFADRLPVYATSQTARGAAGEALAADAGLERFQRTEMPLLGEPRFAPVVDALGARADTFSELYALGFDAYRIAGWLPVLGSRPSLAIPGASGYLWLDEGGRIHRELALAKPAP